MSDWLSRLRQLPAGLLILSVRMYQVTLSPIFGGQCRFEPSCSHYFIQAVQKYGALRGAGKGIAEFADATHFTLAVTIHRERTAYLSARPSPNRALMNPQLGMTAAP